MATIHILSKSTFLRGVQCDKSLYLYKHYYELKDEISPEKQAIFSRGTNVGLLAQQLFPGGIDASPESPFKYAESVEKTRQLLEKGQKVIYEAAFVYDEVLVALDILVNQDGKWYAFEVKSSTRITDTYRLDAALQYWVITNCGIDLEDISIVNIDTKYIKNGEVEVKKLFTKTSVLKDVKKHQSFIEGKIPNLKKMISQPSVPNVKIGPQCFSPYECDFMGHCWKNISKDSIFELGGMNKIDQFKMYEKGIERINEVPANYPLRQNQRIQVDQFNKQEVLVDRSELKKFLNGLEYPLSFFDVETFMPAVPVYDGTRPYENLPFQYSLHVKEQKEAFSKHFEFLAEAGIDPRKSFIENFLKQVEKEGDILVYNQAFETSILKNLARLFPEYKQEMAQVLSRIKDLMLPFKNRWYYHPEMKGSFSIKGVLPALVPELSYEELGIGSGSIAMSSFEQLQSETDIFKIAEIRQHLLDYCKMDTFAMVKILEVLERSVE